MMKREKRENTARKQRKIKAKRKLWENIYIHSTPPPKKKRKILRKK